MKLSDLQNLDPKNIGSWPAPIKALLIIVLCAAVLGVGYWQDTQKMIDKLDKAERKEVELKDVFEAKQRKAANLEPLKVQLEEMEKSFGDMLRLLPNKTEIEGLLVDIPQAGLAPGLEFNLFKPLKEQPKEFYAIQPIQIEVTGTYHEFGEFISAVAALPRIVTQHNLGIKPLKKVSRDGESELTLSVVARTYRYLEEDEIKALQEAEGSKKGKKKRKKRAKKKK